MPTQNAEQVIMKMVYDGSGKRLPMNVSWKSEEGHLVCQWSGAVEPAPYHPPWMQEAGQVEPTGAVPAFLDFTRLSPFGGRRWYDPNRGCGSHAAYSCGLRIQHK
jgi:hypothetical protein